MYLSKTINTPTLDEKFAMARFLVKAVFHLHSMDWLHKSIRSEILSSVIPTVFGTMNDPI